MSGPDAILRAFNLLVPFQGEFPEYNKDEKMAIEFF